MARECVKIVGFKQTNRKVEIDFSPQFAKGTCFTPPYL